MKNKRLFIALAFILILVLTYNYLYKDARNINKEKPVISVTSLKFYSLFQENEKRFNNNYLDKVIQVDGVITEVAQQGLVLDKIVYFTFIDTAAMQNAEINTQITIKGRYVGYDALLEQLKIDQATIINQ